MEIELPVITKGMEVGKINLANKQVIANKKRPIHFACNSRAECCSRMQIPASTYDIKRIQANGYALDQIIKEASPLIFNSSSVLGKQQKAYILKTKPFDGTCTFLEDNLCIIHQFKPFACRIYPFALDFITDTLIRVVIHQDQLCKSIEAVDINKSNNRRILENILFTIQTELQERGYDM